MAQILQIIKKRSLFLLIKNKGIFKRGECMNVYYLNDINVGFIATKRLGNAVKRNKAKRIMRELARKVFTKYGNKNFYYVLIAKKSIFNKTFIKKTDELKKLISL